MSIQWKVAVRLQLKILKKIQQLYLQRRCWMKKRLRKKAWMSGNTKHGEFMFNVIDKVNADGYVYYPKGRYHVDRKGNMYKFKI